MTKKTRPGSRVSQLDARRCQWLRLWCRRRLRISTPGAVDDARFAERKFCLPNSSSNHGPGHPMHTAARLDPHGRADGSLTQDKPESRGPAVSAAGSRAPDVGAGDGGGDTGVDGALVMRLALVVDGSGWRVWW